MSNAIYMSYEIYKLNPECPTNQPTPCYSLRGCGTLITARGNAHIMTCDHLFTDQLEDYCLVVGNKVLATFKFKKTGSDIDAAFVPIGEVDQQTQNVIYKTNGVAMSKFHCHRNQH